MASTPDSDGVNVAAELAGLRGEMSTGFAEIKGRLDLIVHSQQQHGKDIEELEQRVSALEERRIPLGPLAAISGGMSAVVAAVALFLGK